MPHSAQPASSTAQQNLSKGACVARAAAGAWRRTFLRRRTRCAPLRAWAGSSPSAASRRCCCCVILRGGRAPFGRRQWAVVCGWLGSGRNALLEECMEECMASVAPAAPPQGLAQLGPTTRPAPVASPPAGGAALMRWSGHPVCDQGRRGVVLWRGHWPGGGAAPRRQLEPAQRRAQPQRRCGSRAGAGLASRNVLNWGAPL